jgi:hypothetical protein
MAGEAIRPREEGGPDDWNTIASRSQRDLISVSKIVASQQSQLALQISLAVLPVSVTIKQAGLTRSDLA